MLCLDSAGGAQRLHGRKPWRVVQSAHPLAVPTRAVSAVGRAGEAHLGGQMAGVGLADGRRSCDGNRCFLVCTHRVGGRGSSSAAGAVAKQPRSGVRQQGLFPHCPLRFVFCRSAPLLAAVVSIAACQFADAAQRCNHVAPKVLFISSGVCLEGWSCVAAVRLQLESVCRDTTVPAFGLALVTCVCCLRS
jgi:hypothetical protein